MLRTLQLARWLGPWADPARRPEVEIVDDELDGMRVRMFRPRGEPRATYLIAPGLHYAAADDPRMDRFCRVLASAGQLVIVPYVPDFLALVPTAKAVRDFERVFAALPRWSARRPIVFSISFGSLLAFALAAEHGPELERLVIFGGYADLGETLRFCLTGATRDPLNQSVVLINLIDQLEPRPLDRDAVIAGWRRYIERVWGRAEMKVDGRYLAVAAAIAPSVPADVRDLFLVGVGAKPGARELVEDALGRFDARALDPTQYLPRIRNRVDLVHGTDDDVIPYRHAHALAAQLVNADVRVHITGLYGHTGTSRLSPRSAARELATMWRVLRVLTT
jgi:pimeloyl-ACP methyl ester carboxylesterase